MIEIVFALSVALVIAFLLVAVLGLTLLVSKKSEREAWDLAGQRCRAISSLEHDLKAAQHRIAHVESELNHKSEDLKAALGELAKVREQLDDERAISGELADAVFAREDEADTLHWAIDDLVVSLRRIRDEADDVLCDLGFDEDECGEDCCPECCECLDDEDESLDDACCDCPECTLDPERN